MALCFCGLCWESLRKGRTPDLSLANHMFLGDVPAVLCGLTVVKEAMIAHCRAKSWIIQLQEVVETLVPNAQCGMHGHIIVFPQEAERVVDLLPPHIENVVMAICVIFVGSFLPSNEWLHKHAHPLIIRKEKLFATLLWLQLVDDKDVLLVHLEVVPQLFSRDLLLHGMILLCRTTPSRSLKWVEVQLTMCSKLLLLQMLI